MVNRAVVIGIDKDNPIEPYVEPIGNIPTFFLRILVTYYAIDPWDVFFDTIKVKMLPDDNPTIMKNKVTSEVIAAALSLHGAVIIAQDILFNDFTKG